ncbi:MAG: LPS export ABC transporter ATP-binding protein [Bullifex sp.]|nr:LPS export ABC transporter ATP-binding protein [Spirochaetales bacterium]MDY3850322.1 LPS export ABC transporter ATP-binding protein [Bullifex sp.]MDD7007726.1 LPS export ABC transporter ATP-binding protein [Spirochaetales bacterium]MDD7536753.1 LPS export ABC transporter ATP-binding protein [Spirochaetales bacterium]MDY4798426.1 LPS export ABC transporter ATP-binding protein [Bullifex sp.]
MVNTLAVEGLSKFYGRKQVVKGISFSMNNGSVTGLLGPNGAGKTTTFYMIVGFIRSNGGKILLNGENITALPMHKRSGLGLSYLPQESSIFRKLTVEDNIKLVIQTRADLNGQERKELLERLLEEFGVTKVRKQFGYTLSGGERRRTEIARALATNPKFLLLDEPFAGIDPKAVYEIKQIIRKLSEQGIGVLLTDHNVRDTLEITTCAYIINEGSILVSGSRDELIRNEMAREIYFGRDFMREEID